jgi:hypothetical protein
MEKVAESARGEALGSMANAQAIGPAKSAKARGAAIHQAVEAMSPAGGSHPAVAALATAMYEGKVSADQWAPGILALQLLPYRPGTMKSRRLL